MLISSYLYGSTSPLYKLNSASSYDSEFPAPESEINIENDMINFRVRHTQIPELNIIYEEITGKNEELIITEVTDVDLMLTMICNDSGVAEPADSGQLLSGEIHVNRKTSGVENLRIKPGNKIRKLTLLLSETLLQKLQTKETRGNPHFLFNGKMRYWIDLPVKNILSELVSNNYTGIYQQPFLEIKLRELLFHLFIQSQQEPLHQQGIPKELNDKLLSAKAHLVTAFAQPPTIRQLARMVSLNEFKLKQYFKSVFGITIHNFVIRLRMQQAKKMLNQSLSVTEVSEKIGYRSVSHFIETFKNYYGKTPRQLSRSQKT